MTQKTNKKIDKVRLYYDSQGNTLSVWFDDPQKEHISEETGEEVVLNKDKTGKVIGFEKLNFRKAGKLTKQLPVETIIA